MSGELLDRGIAEIDPLVARVLASEERRQRQALHLLAPSMIVTRAIRDCLGSVMGNLDGEGYPAPGLDPSAGFPAFEKEYWLRGGAKYNPSGPAGEYLELLARARIADLLCAGTGLPPEELRVNVQPVSGSVANLAIFRAVLRPGDRVVALDTASGGHLSHGAPFHMTGLDYDVRRLELDVNAEEVEASAVRAAVELYRPRMVIIGASSFPRAIDWRALAEALSETRPRPVLVADIAHFAGLVSVGRYPNPVPWVDVVSFVGYKTFGGPKSAVIATRSEKYARLIDRALFPGLQGAPRLAEICALATAARVAGTPAFHALIEESVRTAAALASELAGTGKPRLAFGGTDSHMVLLQDCPRSPELARYLEAVGVLSNANMLPGDSRPSAATGLRLGMVGACQRGLRASDAPALCQLLSTAFADHYSGGRRQPTVREAVRRFVRERLGDEDELPSADMAQPGTGAWPAPGGSIDSQAG